MSSNGFVKGIRVGFAGPIGADAQTAVLAALNERTYLPFVAHHSPHLVVRKLPTRVSSPQDVALSLEHQPQQLGLTVSLMAQRQEGGSLWNVLVYDQAGYSPLHRRGFTLPSQNGNVLGDLVLAALEIRHTGSRIEPRLRLLHRALGGSSTADDHVIRVFGQVVREHFGPSKGFCGELVWEGGDSGLSIFRQIALEIGLQPIYQPKRKRTVVELPDDHPIHRYCGDWFATPSWPLTRPVVGDMVSSGPKPLPPRVPAVVV